VLNGPDKPAQGSDDLTGMSPLLFPEKGQDAPAAPQDDALTLDAEDLTGMSGLIFGEAGPKQGHPEEALAPLALPPALEQELQLRNLHSAFSGVSPDKLGQAADMAAKAGVPLAVAAQDPEKFRRAMEGNPDWQALLSEAPATVDFLRDGPNMGIAGDSIPQLGEVERLQAALAGYAGRRPEPLPGVADVLSGWAKTGDSPGVFRGFLGGVTETLKGIARGNNILAANFAERRMRGVEADLRAVGYADSDIRAYLDDGRPLPEMPNEAALPWYWRLSNSRPEQEGTRTPDQAAWLNSAPLMRAWYGLWRNVSESNRNGWLSAANKDSRWGKLFRADQDFAANLQRYGGLPRLSFDLGNGVASMANSMAWALMGSPMAGVGAMYAQIAGGDLERGEAEGLDADKNWRWANWNALLQSPMEALSLGKALAVWKPGKVLGQRFKALVESMLTEGTTEYAQSYVEELADLYRHSDKESLAELQTFFARVSTARFQADAGYQGAVGALSSALVGGPRVVTAMWTRNPQGQDQITNLAQAVEQVQALKRSAVVAEAFTAQLVEKGRLPGKVFVPAQALQTYFQVDPTSARLEGFLATAGLDMAAYQAALGTGADLEIEGRKLGPVFQTEAGKALRDAFTMNPVEREAAEMVSQIVQDVDAGSNIEQAAASAADRMQAEELFKAPIAEPSQYREQVVRSMVGAGLAENRARKVADLIDANARIWATIPGESVQSYYERYGFRFRKTAFGRIMQQMFLDHGAGLGVSTFEQMVSRYNTSPRFREKVHRMVPRYLEAEVQAEAPVLDLAGVESVVREAARALNLDPAAAWAQVQGLVGGLDVPSIVDAVRGVAGDALAGEVQKVFTGRDQAAEKRRVLDIERWAREQAAVQRDASLEAYNAVVGRIRELGGLNSQDIMREHGKGALETLQSTLGRDIVSRTGTHPDALAGEFQELAGHLGTFADNGLADGQAVVEWLLNAGNKKAIQERYRRDVEALKAEAEGLPMAAQERLHLAEPEVDEVPFQRRRPVLLQDDLGFYSPVARAVDGMEFKTIPAGDLVNRIKKLPGVKQEELDDLGLLDWLGGLKGQKVTKEQVLDFIQAGGPKFEEVVLQHSPSSVHIDLSLFKAAPRADVDRAVKDMGKAPFRVEKDGDGYALVHGENSNAPRVREKFSTREDAEEAAYAYSLGFLRAGRGGDSVLLPDLPAGFFVGRATQEDADRLGDGVTRPGDWTLYGGTDRSEPYVPIMTFPNETDSYAEAVVQGRSALDSVPGLEAAYSKEWKPATESAMLPKYELHSLPGGKNYREFLLRLPGSGYKHAHWPVGDVLAHLRVKEFQDEAGKRVLLVDEVQSDWHQAGRKKGYQGHGSNMLYWVENVRSGNRGQVFTSREEAEADLQRYPESMQKNLRLASGAADAPGAVPNAPFKKSWALLGFKRAMRLAAEEGFDSVAWTPGEVQADRYDLSRHIREIRYAKEGDSYFLRAWDQADGNTILDEVIPSDNLDDFVGKDVAEKIRRGDGEDAPGSFFKGNTVRDATLLSGLDLKTGGEGMRGFYDKMLPKMVGEYARKLDKGAKLETTRIPLPDPATLEEQSDLPSPEVIEAGHYEVWNLPLTDALRSAVLAGQPLYQGKQAPIGPRGATQFAQDGQALIHFFEAKNLSTAPHEVYHVFRRVLEDMAGHPNAPQWVKDDWSRACEFVGAEVGQRWTPEQEEKWARAGEAYLREGQAPAPGLRGVFTTFRRWMRTIYDTVLQLGVHLSPDMRGVFDRLLATDEEIAQARERVDARPMLDLEQAAAEYVEAARKAQVVADEAIEKRRLEEHARRLPAWTKQAKEDVDKHPGQRLLADIVAGDGLNLEALRNEVPLDDRTLSRIRALRPGTNLASEAGTVDARALADAHGFETVGEMVAELLDTPTKSELLKARVSELEEQFNAEWDPEVAILSDEYERLAEMEAEVLAENAKGRPARASEIKRIVRERTGQMRTEYIQVSEIEALKSVVRREAAAARTAYRAGKNDMALAAKERQRRAIAELRERFKAKQEVGRIIAAAKRAAKSKSISWGFHEQVLELVRRFGLGTDTMVPRRPEERPALADFLVSHGDLFGPAGAAPDLAEWIIASDGQDTNYRELTLDQLRDVAEAVEVLSHQGRDYDKLIAGQEKAALRDVADQSVATMADLGTKRPLTDRERKTVLGRGKAFVRRFSAELGMVEFWLKAADGFKKGAEAMAAPLYRHLVQPVVDARAAELSRWEDVGRALDAALAPMKQWAKDRIFIPDVLLPRDVAAAWEGSWTREKVFMLALNMGNAGNRKALRRGYGQVVNGEFMEFSDEAMDRVVSHLTDADWDMVEKVWSLVDTIFPEVEAAYFKLNGKKLRKVEAEPFYTPDGRLVRGGYFPLIFDRQFSRQAGRQIEADEIMNSREAVLQKPNPSSGMTKERKGGTLPPRLSLSVLHKHLYDSIHYATHAVAMRDAARLVMDERWADSFTQHFGADAYEQLLPWLRYIARPERERGDAFEDFVNRMRNKATVATLGLNPQVAIKQVTSITGTMKEVGVLRTLKAMGQMIGSGDMSRVDALAFVDSRSPFMRNRAEQIDREMKQVLDRYDVDRKSIKVGDHELTWNEFHEFCFWGIRAMDAVATYPSWMASYSKGLEDAARAGVVDQAAADAQAARYADDVVRQTQPASNPMDLAHFQRSSQGIKRVFSMFLTFTLKFANRQAYHLRGLREGKIGAGEYAKHFWLEWMVPPIAVEVILAALKSGDLPEWEEDPKSLPLALAGYWLSGIPVVRNIAGAIQYGRSVTDSPMLQGFDSLYALGRGSFSLAQDMWTGQANTDDYLRWLRQLSEAASFAYGVPIKWAPTAWEGMRDWIDGKTSNPARLLFRDPNEKR
jgi:hypothetical protein